MSKIDPAQVWSLNYRLSMAVISSVSPVVSALGLEAKELFVLAEVDESPYPAQLAEVLSMPRPTITVYLKRLEAAGFLRREIDPSDLRCHRLEVTPAGRKVMTKGMALLSNAFESRLSRLSRSEQAEFKALLEKMS